ncbi:hypothetical protein [Leptospirillum ferriphilum]|uniref:hypothetical protein n=1 Tax=Leptospirillum ferriphilum TaxID=178606 RepID=UPI0012373EE8|nr:hypothetical protein [Leptospirillum ferriphilum]
MQGRPRIKGPQKSTPVFEFQGVGLDGPKEHFASNILPIDIREDVMGCFPQKLGLDLTRDEKAKIGKIKQKGAMRRISCFGSGSGRNWSGKRDSNPRPSPWQGDLTPFLLLDVFLLFFIINDFVILHFLLFCSILFFCWSKIGARK